MANEDFKVGDVVQLKSGGPKMTVNRVDGDEISCEWFEGRQEPHGHVFKKEVLMKILNKKSARITPIHTG